MGATSEERSRISHNIISQINLKRQPYCASISFHGAFKSLTITPAVIIKTGLTKRLLMPSDAKCKIFKLFFSRNTTVSVKHFDCYCSPKPVDSHTSKYALVITFQPLDVLDEPEYHSTLCSCRENPNRKCAHKEASRSGMSLEMTYSHSIFEQACVYIKF